ncbi:MAG: type VI secretion system tip protein VgrG, partial [Bacteroidota bacterium]
QELVQFEMTDWDFLLTRIEANGGVVSVEDGKINALAPAIGEEALEVQYGASIEEFDAEMDARWQHTSVTAYSWDYAAGEAIEAAATEPELEEAGNLQISTLSEVIGLESYNLYHTGQVVQEELQAWADAKLLKTRLSKIRGRVKFQGFAALKPSDTLLLTGVGERMSGKVYVSGVRHELSNGSWYTDAQFGLKPEFFSKENSLHPSKAGGLLAAVNGLQIGVVTQLEEDPTGEERIKVKLPIISAEEDGIWARVASFDAGAEGRGAFFRPEVEDEVIVGFLNDDPRDPIVLGMLYSSGKAAPIVATAENNESGIFTKGKMKFVLNDEAKSIAMETESGNSLLISEEEGGIILKDENGNQISLNSSGITIESAGTLSLAASSGDVKIEGINIEQAAQAQFKAEGAAGLEVSSSAVAVLKGALVQIN